jgi:hypothetical protein
MQQPTRSHTQTRPSSTLGTVHTYRTSTAETIFSLYGDDRNSWRSTKTHSLFRHNSNRESASSNYRPMSTVSGFAVFHVFCYMSIVVSCLLFTRLGLDHPGARPGDALTDTARVSTLVEHRSLSNCKRGFIIVLSRTSAESGTAQGWRESAPVDVYTGIMHPTPPNALPSHDATHVESASTHIPPYPSRDSDPGTTAHHRASVPSLHHPADHPVQA